ncbi:hypothetical protein SSS_01200 [Sarcoptes scabiei]|uniref:Uncharacterized protein n=1 Tax=Sarcoptes scabiei TaxID=52283 RepID=A0A834R4B1_SARSC|nr:hypothetical protein SSS_01200 [Sarcoptes scabiei]
MKSISEFVEKTHCLADWFRKTLSRNSIDYDEAEKISDLIAELKNIDNRIAELQEIPIIRKDFESNRLKFQKQIESRREEIQELEKFFQENNQLIQSGNRIKSRRKRLADLNNIIDDGKKAKKSIQNFGTEENKSAQLRNNKIANNNSNNNKNNNKRTVERKIVSRSPKKFSPKMTRSRTRMMNQIRSNEPSRSR